jgi:hypothetical protein
MLTCEQVEGMNGPENDDCACAACVALRAMTMLLSSVVRHFDQDMMGEIRAEAGGRFASPWSLVLCIAAGRLRAQHVPGEVILDMAIHGIQQAEDQNELLLMRAKGGVS